jgi:chromosome segregation ATPase
MGALKHVVLILTVILAGIARAGQDQPRTDAEAVNLIGQKSELTRKGQAVELDLAGIDARRKALQEQMATIRSEASKGSASVGPLDEFTRDLNRLAVDKAQKEAQQQVLRRQLDQVQKQLAQAAPQALRTDAEAVNLIGQRSELTRRAQGLEVDLAGIDARRKALQEQIATLRGEAGKGPGDGEQLAELTRELNRLAVDKVGKGAQQQVVRRQLEEVQKQLAQVAPAAPRTDQEAVNLGGQKNELTRRAQVLELELAGIDARRKALQEQIAAMRGEAGQGATGGGQLAEFTRELNRLAVDKAGKEAQQQVLRRQLDEVQKQLAQALASGQ